MNGQGPGHMVNEVPEGGSMPPGDQPVLPGTFQALLAGMPGFANIAAPQLPFANMQQPPALNGPPLMDPAAAAAAAAASVAPLPSPLTDAATANFMAAAANPAMLQRLMQPMDLQAAAANFASMPGQAMAPLSWGMWGAHSLPFLASFNAMQVTKDAL